MSTARPPSRPKENLAQLTARAAAAGIRLPDPTKEVFVVAIRGYYRDSLGQPGQNDVGMYDDAIFISCPPMGKVPTWTSFNANTDPSRSCGRLVLRITPRISTPTSYTSSPPATSSSPRHVSPL